MHPNKEIFTDKAEMLGLLANPVRLCIVYGLYKSGTRCVGEIQGCVNVPQSSVSQHLAKLRSAGIVRSERHANEVYYELVNEEVRLLIQQMFGDIH